MLRRVALVRNGVSEELTASITRVTGIGEPGTLAFVARRLLVTANVVPSSLIFVILMMEAPSSFETSVLTRATRRNTPDDAILQLNVWFKPSKCKNELNVTAPKNILQIFYIHGSY
jgi:hypothetical protein